MIAFPLKQLTAVATTLLLLAHSTSALAFSPAQLKIADHIKGADGGWDYATADGSNHKLYVARPNGVMLVNTADKSVTDTFVPGQRVHGIVLVPGTTQAMSTNGETNTVSVFDTTTGKVSSTIATGQKPDAIVWEPKNALVAVMNGKSGDVSLIDPAKSAVIDTIMVGGALEFAAPDGKGLLYVNIEDKSEIAVLDIAARKVVRRIALKGCEEPSGLAYEPTTGLLVSACANGMAKVVDAATGKIIATPVIGPSPDAAILDAARKWVFIPSGGDGTLSVIALRSKTDARVIAKIKTHNGARTGAFDDATGKLYLPTAEYGPPAKGEHRPKPLPGSFEVLVVSTR